MDNFNIKNEAWKDIDGYEGRYQISSLGKVKSTARTITKKNGVKHTTSEKVLNQYKSTNGYLQVYLYRNGKKKSELVHRLVGKAFVVGDFDLEINHINENKQDNRVINLEWVTRVKNRNHHDLANRIGEKRKRPISMADIETDEIIKVYGSIKSATEELGIKYNSSIIKACNGRYKQAHGYKWKYV